MNSITSVAPSESAGQNQMADEDAPAGDPALIDLEIADLPVHLPECIPDRLPVMLDARAGVSGTRHGCI